MIDTLPSLDAAPRQLLPRESYVSEDWFRLEQEQLLGKGWVFAGVTDDFPEAGDTRVVRAGAQSLIVLRDGEGKLRGFHNLCRHRGLELLEECKNVGRNIMCPYHNWVYNLDGRLRGIPAQRECFPDIDKKAMGLRPAAVGSWGCLVFVNPDPNASFEDWLGGVQSVPFPHQLEGGDLEEAPDELVYEIECNWKVFFENAIDGYHLAYLHKDTLGGPVHDKNIWEAFGRNLIWWSIEREGVRHRIPQFVEDAGRNSGMKIAKGADEPGYGGVYMLYPTTILTPNPWGFSISVIEPVSAGKTLLKVRNWSPKGWLTYKTRAKDVPGYDPASGRIKSSHWDKHPLETGDFQTEDVWVCEKMQRGLQSPYHSVGAMAQGSGAEAALSFFQSLILKDTKAA